VYLLFVFARRKVSFAMCAAILELVIAVLAVATASAAIIAQSECSLSSTVPKPFGNVSYWSEDNGYKYEPPWKRLPSGKFVPNNEASFGGIAGYRGAVEAQTPWISKWVLSTEGRRTLKKDIPRLLMYNLVSPMDYGSSLRSSNVRRRRNKAIGMFLTDNVAIPLLKSLGRVAWNLIQKHYIDYFKDEMFAQRLELMNASEIIREFNLTLPADALLEVETDECTPNSTQRYVLDGESRRLSLYIAYSAAFTPYEGYSNQYYTRDDDLPPPTLPADSYPWLWSPRLRVTRALASQIMQLFSHSEDDVDGINDGSSTGGSDDAHLDACSSSCSSSKNDGFLRKLTIKAAGSSSLESTNSTTASGNDVSRNATTDAEDIQALEQIQAQLQEFYFDTGIPRLEVRSNVSHSVFPSYEEVSAPTSSADANSSLARESARGKSIGNFSAAGTAEYPDFEKGNDGGNASSRSSVYDALVHFYAYPECDTRLVLPAKEPASADASAANCTVERPCLVQSGVTVYTPALATLTLFQIAANSTVAQATKRAARLEALLGMVQVAFEAERRALKHGLQSPSTVWYSIHDLDTDEFADAVLGTVNMSISGETGDSTALHVFDKHMNGRVAVLDDVVSYYADTNHDTEVSMKRHRSVPTLDKFQERELVELVSCLQRQMELLDRSVVSYVEARTSSPQYQEVMSATKRGDLYNGSEYTLLSFGFVVPATNDQNVLYRDMKLPVPFHLVLRLLVRFQESHLLLPDESRQLVVCLAMAVYDISFYRCRRTASD
jgi:hypothetical protein